MIAAIGLGGFLIASLMSFMAICGLVAAAEAGRLPSAVAETLLTRREAGGFMSIAGAIAALHPFLWALAYLGHRKRPDLDAYDSLRTSSLTVMHFWILLGVAATAYIFWQGPAAQAAS